MNGEALRTVRKQRGWTQVETSARLGVSQSYLALLEKGRRRMPLKLARKAVQVLKLTPACVPPSGKNPSGTTTETVVRDLSRLGYPGFRYVRGGWVKNPGEVLLSALAQPNLDSRVAEALPWVLLHYSDMDANWLVTQARLLNLTNRLGFAVDLARGVARRNGDSTSPRYVALTRLAGALQASRLAAEDTFGQQFVSAAERDWVYANRPTEAQFWNVLTDWRPETLQYTT